MAARRKILFFGEGATLAHVARPYLLAQSLDPGRYEVILARPESYGKLFRSDHIRFLPLHSIPSAQFLKALASGSPLYDTQTLHAYLREDLQLIEQEQPDLVVGDFRLSLAVSAPLARVPYAALTNAHWSPYSTLNYWPIPEHISAKLFGVAFSQYVFNRIRPLIIAAHARPLDRLRKAHSLEPFGDMREAYTHGDFTFYLDTPGLVPTKNLPEHHRYLGPVIWSPDMPLPSWWQDLDRSRPIIYLTLGSSGQIDALPVILSALNTLPLTVIVATAGRFSPGILRGFTYCFAADYLPGSQAAALADLVICNGGSATVYQALAAGRPVLGIPANLDQHLTMAFVTRASAGLSIRSDSLTTKAIAAKVRHILENDEIRLGAHAAAEEFGVYPSTSKFCSWVEHYLS